MSGEDPLLGDWYDVWCNSGPTLSAPVANLISSLPTPSPTPVLTPTSTPTWNQLIETAKQIPYDELLRHPKLYEDEIVYFQAKIEQTRKYNLAGKNKNVFILIASVTPIDHNHWKDKVHLTFYNAPANLQEGDVVQFVGILEEVTSYESEDKQLITMPTITILQLTVE